ncbi:MAG: FAD-binding protein [SAR324 cluster bacterium]|nr:FAD-binding protein [SAR324 cluster bacterium]
MKIQKKELSNKIDILLSYLEKAQVWFKKEYELKYETYFKTGGVAKVFIYPQNTATFIQVIKQCKSVGIEYKIVGLTSNVFFLNEIDYTVVITTKLLNEISIGNMTVDVECGYPLEDFVRVMLLQHATGYEGLEGIPGTIGGAVVMNAGAYGTCISDNIVSVTYCDSENEIVVQQKADCRFGYRTSIFRNINCAVLSVRIKMDKGPILKIRQDIEKYHIARHCYQEYSCPNLGSLFSLDGDMGKTLLRNDNKFRLNLYYFLRTLFYNPVFRFIRRKRPQQIRLNKLITRYIKTGFYEPSVKSMNILCNNGENSTVDMIQYIKTLKERIEPKANIENEIVTNAVFSYDDDFIETYKRIQETIL